MCTLVEPESFQNVAPPTTFIYRAKQTAGGKLLLRLRNPKTSMSTNFHQIGSNVIEELL
jgi:hypothetical protein